MRYSIISVVAAAASLPFVAAADSPSPSAETISYGYVEFTGTDYIAYLTSHGVKPSAATYAVTVVNNPAVESAFQALYSADLDNVVIPESLATITATTDIVAALKIEEAAITAVPEQYRSILSSVINEQIALQTAAARPTDLALSAAVAGIVGGVAGLAIAL